MQSELWTTALSLRAAGRTADAENVEATINLLTETGEWVACLRCGMAFPTAAAHSAHYSKEHPFRSYASRGMAAPLGGSR
jgi:hypothetical protein